MLIRPRWPKPLPPSRLPMAGTKPSTGTPALDSRSSGVLTMSSMYSTRNATLAGLGNIEKRIIAHLKGQNDILRQQLDKARTNLFPLGQPQERVFTVVAYLVRYGTDLLAGVLEACAAHGVALESLSADP